MSFKEMQMALTPTVDGSRHNDLDFFVLFGSSVDVMGKFRSSSTHPVPQIRLRTVSSHLELVESAVAGSLIGLGDVKGVGYAARMNRGVDDIIGIPLLLSEKEGHDMFTDGVLAGAPGSTRDPILSAGMDSKDHRKDPDALWYPHPKLGHYIQTGDGVTATESGSTAVGLKSQLVVAASTDDVLNIVTAAFTLTLRHKLHTSFDTVVPSEAVLLELGIESLVAVDLRAWFVNELGGETTFMRDG